MLLIGMMQTKRTNNNDLIIAAADLIPAQRKELNSGLQGTTSRYVTRIQVDKITATETYSLRRVHQTASLNYLDVLA